jgi:hypothetical protein
MYARHPKTGAPIRIMTSEGLVWRDAKTLVWLDADADPAVKWDRWDIGAASIETWTVLNGKGIKPDVVLLLGDTEAAAEWLRAGNWSKAQIVAAPKVVLDMIGLDTLVALRITNMMCLEECADLYPHIGAMWDGTEEDAKCILALVLHYRITFPLVSSRGASLGLTKRAELSHPAPLILLTQYYVPDKTARAKEINACLANNAACRYIDRIVLLNEKEYELPVSIQTAKIEQEVVGGRLRFDTAFKWIYEKAPRDSYVVITNSDIYLDQSWKLLWSIGLDDTFLSLLRWDDVPGGEPKLFGPRADSQDSWVISANSVKARTWDWNALAIPFGKGGCDNAINVELLRQKFRLANPCMNLITHHLHTSGYRTYDPQDIVERPAYMYLTPTGIHDLKPEYTLPVPAKTYAINASEPAIRGPQAQVDTFRNMVSKKQPLTAAASTIPVYTATNVFQTNTGLAYTYNSILLGKSKAAAAAWASTEMSVVAACVEVDTALIAYCPDSVAANPLRYILNYLGKIFVLRDLAAGRGECIGDKTKDTLAALEIFQWNNGDVNILSRDRSFQAWCKTAHIWIPQDGTDAFVSNVEIDALRAALRSSWTPTVEAKRIVCVVDGVWCTDEFVAQLEKELEPNGYTVSCLYKDTSIASAVETLKGAAEFIVVGSDNAFSRWALFWALPKGARVHNIQVETAPSMELAHLCSAAGLEHSIQFVPRPVPGAAVECVQLCQRICSTLSTRTRPLILVPKSTGFFSHAGDSFREMVEIWRERGYVDVQYVPDLCHVWMNAVGDTLLYDRPTHEWLNACNAAERVWRVGLFGNPVPPAKGSAWSFWPRRPRLVEKLYSLPQKERTMGVVFYGRSENAVQRGRRTLQDWSSSCDEYVHMQGDKSYVYSQEEYLIRLSNAKWGLCLAGYGLKCHREIECMAMGCVPLVAPEVDMDSYASPPVEGVHYFRVSKPEDVSRISRETTGAKWLEMSKAARAWWMMNASAEGMWLLTKAKAGGVSKQ